MPTPTSILRSISIADAMTASAFMSPTFTASLATSRPRSSALARSVRSFPENQFLSQVCVREGRISPRRPRIGTSCAPPCHSLASPSRSRRCVDTGLCRELYRASAACASRSARATMSGRSTRLLLSHSFRSAITCSVACRICSTRVFRAVSFSAASPLASARSRSALRPPPACGFRVEIVISSNGAHEASPTSSSCTGSGLPSVATTASSGICDLS